ncbi:hypothetical protein [Halostagnicola sp. A-GB9-2]|uniref:hypothetical protein n=1 Tax=Halostagnicola sp. A-GB9-2 TaxID=3048066 RepID=UPI0024C04AB7|nr:hypothetical protein [Halostagnicola sp. A-GB9-2]MDJ1433567.1 hypothetical protein [Halostagnicola sp. A-GB9-2]
MSFPSPGLVLEVTPFISIIIVEIATSGGEGKFDGEFQKQPEYDVIGDSPASAKNIQYTALFSYHYEQSMRYFDIATIAAFVIFLTRLHTTEDTSGLVVFAGVVSICFIVSLRVWMRRYFESKTPTEYARKDWVWNFRGLIIRKGDLAIVTANLAPVACLVFLDFM